MRSRTSTAVRTPSSSAAPSPSGWPPPASRSSPRSGWRTRPTRSPAGAASSSTAPCATTTTRIAAPLPRADLSDPYHAARALVDAFLGLGRELRLRTLAEGVETAEQHAQLVTAGGDAAQGYLFAPPMAAVRLRGRLADHHTRIPGRHGDGDGASVGHS